MPDIKCHQGCSMTIGIDQWVATLTIDQMRYTCETMGEKIKAAEEPPKRTVWRICRVGLCEANYREDDYEKAADHLLRIYKERFKSKAAELLKKPCGYLNFERDLPHINLNGFRNSSTTLNGSPPNPNQPSAAQRGGMEIRPWKLKSSPRMNWLT